MTTLIRSRKGRHPRRPRLRPRRLGASLVFLLCVSGVALLGILLSGLSSGMVSAAPTTTNSTIRLYGAAQSQVNNLTGQAGVVQAEINALDDELEKATEAYNHLSVKLDQINVRMTDLRRELTQAQSDHGHRLKKFQERLVGVYKAGGRDQLLKMLLLSSGVEDLLTRVRVVAQLADQDNKLVENLRDSSSKLDSLLKEIDGNKREELVIRGQMGDERDRIQARLAARQAALADIDGQIAQVIEQERVRQAAEQERLKKSLFGLIDGSKLYYGPLPQTDNAVIDQFIQTAATYMGIPYVWAGDRPSTGFDCSGFTQYVFAQHGIYLPHYSGFQAQMGIAVDPSDAKPGDLLAFGAPVHHVGIYLGDGYFIHAPRTGDVIKISHLSEKKNLSAIRRFPVQQRMGPPAIS